jgi:hypothetical protein
VHHDGAKSGRYRGRGSRTRQLHVMVTGYEFSPRFGLPNEIIPYVLLVFIALDWSTKYKRSRLLCLDVICLMMLYDKPGLGLYKILEV